MQFPTVLTDNANALFSSLMERVFGPNARNPVLGPISWADFGLVVCLLLAFLFIHTLAAVFLRRTRAKLQAESQPTPWRLRLFTLCGKPLYFLIWLYGFYFASTLLLLRLAPTAASARALLSNLLNIGTFCLLCWLFIRVTRVLEAWLRERAAKSESCLDDVLLPLLAKISRVALPVTAVVLALPVLGLSPAYTGFVNKGSSLLIIGSITWALFQGVNAIEAFVLAKYNIHVEDNLQARKIHTQVRVISKTVYFIIGIFAVASALMLFEEVRRIGASILASAGVLGLIIGFAAQKTIANLFAGFQLAMTQPIRLDDVVIVESEWGRVEEITLTYVIVHIWDDRRLVVPLSYFIEKPFQNWTRVSASLLGSVFLWVDYTLPISELRDDLQQIVESCTGWDRRFWNLQVTDANERAMQIRVLVTAADSGKAWDLRCEIREKLIALIQNKHPQGLPRIRNNFTSANARAEGGVPVFKHI